MKVLERIKITSDGTPQGTSIIDMETGKNIGAVFEIDWHMDMNSVPTAAIKMYSQIEVEGRGLVFTVCPTCRKEQEEESATRREQGVKVHDPRKTTSCDRSV